MNRHPVAVETYWVLLFTNQNRVRVVVYCDLIIEKRKFEERDKGNKASSSCTDLTWSFPNLSAQVMIELFKFLGPSLELLESKQV